MELVLFRHGIAAPRESHNGPDATRELTEHGRLRTRAAARGLAVMEVEPQLVVSSPLVRARQTAEILAEVLQVRRPIEIVDELTPGTLPGVVLHKLDDLQVGCMVCVGHGPDIDLILRALIDGGVAAISELKKAAAVSIECQRPSDKHGLINWLLPPKALRQLGKGED
jgi:phosphohistidine phosphatase